MEFLLWAILIYCLVLAFLIYVFICGNTSFHRDGIIGFIYRFFTKTIPHKLNSLSKKYVPTFCSNWFKNGCFSSNGKCKYFVVIFFYCIYAFFITANFVNVYPHADDIFTYPSFYKFFSVAVLPWPWILVIMFQFVDPGTITPTNVLSYLEIYPHDNQLYIPSVCKTTKLPVVPRSRYDTYTNRRIARYDHYCPWVLSPIGEKNHLMFILFLSSCLASSAYYSYCYVSLLIWAKHFIRGYHRSFTDILYLLLEQNPIIFGCSICLIMVSIALSAFLFFQFRNISHNVTTIEVEKYNYLRDKREKEKDETQLFNYYDEGFYNNWRQFLFPAKPEEREPFKIDIE